MAGDKATVAQVAERLREFDRVASLLAMPIDERCGILNISEEAYYSLHSGKIVAFKMVGEEFRRRLTYALPLMRKLASNSPVLQMPLPRSRAAA